MCLFQLSGNCSISKSSHPPRPQQTRSTELHVEMADISMESASDDSEIEDLDEEIVKIKQKLLEDSGSISAANRLLDLLRKNGDFEELEEKRKEIVEWAPLSPVNWINWIKDALEKEDSSVEKMEKMFEKALFDENDVAIWAERIFYAHKVDFDFCRKICEQALTAIGSRYDAGGHVWIIFLEYEREHLKTYLNHPDLQKKLDQLVNLYQRALRCATTQLEEIYQEAELFCQETDQQHHLAELKRLFESTMKQKRQLEQFETLIGNSDTKKEGLRQFFEYEKKSGMPARIQMAHERMVAELDDDEDVWSAYGAWTETVLKLPQVSVEVYERGLRHCPYSYVLHQQALLAFERAKRPSDVIDQLWRRAQSNVINSSDEGRGLYRTYAFLLRRRIASSESHDYSPMGEVLDEGAAVLKEWFSMAWDPATEYRQMHAHFWASLGKNMDKCRQIWNDILASGSGRFAAKWIEAVRVERQFGDLENARKYLNKALNSVSDNINEIYAYYVQFEREEGTLAELDAVLEKVNSQVAHRAQRPQKKVVEKVEKPEKSAKRSVGGEPIVKKVRGDDGGFKAPLPPPTTSSSSSSSLPEKSAPKAVPGTEDARTVFVSNLEFSTTDDDIRQAIPGVESIRFARKAHTEKTHRGFAYVVMKTELDAKNALKRDRVPVKGRPMFISENDPEKRVGFKYATGLEKTKIFVRNVHFQATDEELKEVFSRFGPVKSVRRVTHRDGKPKGMAYIEYETEQDAQKCVEEKDQKLTIRERELSVALSDPPRKDQKGKGQNFAAKTEEGDGQRKGHAAKLQLVPRALAKKPASQSSAPQITARLEAMDTSEDVVQNADASAKKPLSNDQFRQFLLKK